MTTLTKRQINWLDKCTDRWMLIEKTGLVDVYGHFDCSFQRLSDFKGVKFGWVEDGFYCQKNRLTSLEGAPKHVGGTFDCRFNLVSEKTLMKIFTKMYNGDSFVIAAASLRNEMSEKDWRLISPNIPEAIQPGVSMLARFGVFR